MLQPESENVHVGDGGGGIRRGQLQPKTERASILAALAEIRAER